MKIIQVIILGIIQGIAEFLPISSSAHLIIFRDIFGIGQFITGEFEMSFDIALHFGTLLAILVYFFKDFFKMIKDGFTKGVKTTDGKILWYIVVATIPAAIFGVLFEDKIDELVRSNYVLICGCLALMGIIIYLCDKRNKQTKTFKTMKLKIKLLGKDDEEIKFNINEDINSIAQKYVTKKKLDNCMIEPLIKKISSAIDITKKVLESKLTKYNMKKISEIRQSIQSQEDFSNEETYEEDSIEEEHSVSLLFENDSYEKQLERIRPSIREIEDVQLLNNSM